MNGELQHIPAFEAGEVIDAIPVVKTCRGKHGCGRVLPLEAFQRNKRTRSGRFSQCRACVTTYQRQWRAANAEKRSEYNRQYRAANIEKLREYDRQRRADDAGKREYNRQYYAANAGKLRAVARQHRAANAEEYREYYRQRYAANAEKHREYARRYRAANTEKHRERARLYFAANPERRRESRSRRRARKAEATVENFSHADLAAFWKADGIPRECVICYGPHEHTDHVIPLARGGAHAMANLVPMCSQHNTSKNAALPEEYADRLEGIEAVRYSLHCVI